MSKQLVFTRKTPAIKINIDGKPEKVIFGQYEAIMITKENGLDVDRTRTLNIPTYPVKEVECEDGTKYIFDEPFYCIEKGD